ncbi:unnamed protein product [Oppiella nova]|uniref:Uncharacterized protein n=1 Tax=Oppiella nova TaxID=334625 RepID=A0A7R9LCE5_9ACAR|nr:unnamed protein product [Oppiella nova]CAG2162008.1 unnamed protein product [Oppiella nova]
MSYFRTLHANHQSFVGNALQLCLQKIKKEEAKKAGPKVWTPDKLKIDKSALNVGPRRFSDNHLKDLDSLMDDVYVTELYKQRHHSLVEAIAMHRETHDKTVLNDPNAVTFFLLDKFDAKEAGADVVGGLEIIKMLQKGDLSMSNFDDLVCHGDLLVELAGIRGLLMQAFPTKQSPLDPKLYFFDHLNPSQAHGKPADDMSDQHLHQNLTFLLSTIEKHKPSTSIVPFITRVLIRSEPSKEEFALKFWDYVDGYEARNAEEAVDDEADDKGDDDKALTSL